jgi:ABC-2 type transport system ATP-binding protein
MSILVQNITKLYGKQKALDNVSFSIEPGQVVGFLGPNGAGKSTMMKIISCFIPQTEGTVTVNGLDVNNDSLKVRKLVGYLPEHNPLYLDMYVKEFLTFIGRIQLSADQLKKRLPEILEMTGLSPEQNKKIGDLSKGYRQRVGLAQALIHDPEVLILDEPTTGLDPNQLVEIRSLIKSIGKQKTVILSTHIMQEVEAICERVLIINKGVIVADDNTAALRKGNAAIAETIVEFDKPIQKSALLKLPGVKSVESLSGNSWKVASNMDVDIRPSLFQFAVEQQVSVLTLKREENSLEDIFHQLTGANEISK